MSWISYDTWDWWNESYNEKKKKEYQKVNKKIGEFLVDIDNRINNIEDKLDNIKSVYRYTGGFEGKISNNFEAKTIKYETQLRAYLTTLKSARELVYKNKARSQNIYDEYNQKCIQEDIVGRERWEDD